MIGHVLVKVVRGKTGEVSWLMYALVPLLPAFYASGWLGQHVFFEDPVPGSVFMK